MAAHDRDDVAARRAGSVNVQVLPQRPIDGPVVKTLGKSVHHVRAAPPWLGEIVVDSPIQVAAVPLAAAGEQFGRRIEARTVGIVSKVAESGEHQGPASDQPAFVNAAEFAPQEHGPAHVDPLP